MTAFFNAFFLSFFVLLTANIEMPQDAPPRQELFNEILMRTGMKLQETAAKRPHKLKGMNDSIEAMAQAMRAMASHGEPAFINARLEAAAQAYPDNPFVFLLQGIMAGTAGDIPASNAYFERFLVGSAGYTEFEKSFIPWDPYHKLRRLVYELLTARGVTFEGREKTIQAHVPFQTLMEYVRSPEPRDEAWNLFFVIFLSLGTIGFFLAHLRGADLTGYWMQTLFYEYLAAWIAYGIWFCDLAVDLPGGWSRFTLMPVILAVPLVWRLVLKTGIEWYTARAPLEEGYQRCPHCRAVIQELLVECPECRCRLS